MLWLIVMIEMNEWDGVDVICRHLVDISVREIPLRYECNHRRPVGKGVPEILHNSNQDQRYLHFISVGKWAKIVTFFQCKEYLSVSYV